MATKKQVLETLEPLLPEGVILNIDDYTKKELVNMLDLAAKGEDITGFIKNVDEDEPESGPGSGRTVIMVEDPELLEKVGASEAIPRQEYIRARFNQNTRRREIAEELGVAYQIVFAATKELENTHHQPGKRGGRTATVTVTDPETGEEREMQRTDYMREQYQLGRDRSDIAQELGISYGLVYSATKGIERDEEVVAAYRQEHYGKDEDDDDDDEDGDGEFLDMEDGDEDEVFEDEEDFDDVLP